MKRTIVIALSAIMLSIMLSGCASLVEQEVDVNAGEAYDLNEYEFDEVPDGIYVKADLLLYAPYKGHTISAGASVSLMNYISLRNSRFIWYTTQLNNVPVLNDDGIVIYKSEEMVPESFTLESYEKLCDSIGMRGLSAGKNGRYYLNSSDSAFKADSSAYTEMYELCSGRTLIIETINGIPLEPSMINKAGAITGLEKGKMYRLGFYIGTKYYERDVLADTTFYSSKDYSLIEDYDETKDGYIILRLPDLLEPGLYNIDGEGTFWYEGITAAEQVIEPAVQETPPTEAASADETTLEMTETLPIGGYYDETESVSEETLPDGTPVESITESEGEAIESESSDTGTN